MDMKKLMEQAQQMQAKMVDCKKEVENMSVVGTAGGGSVKVEMRGNFEVKNIEIDEGLINKDVKSILEDLMVAACSNAYKNVKEMVSKKFAAYGLPEGI